MLRKPLLIPLILLLLLVWWILPGQDNYPIVNKFPVGDAIVSFGDSLTYGTGAAKGFEYPTQLARLINEPIINMGKPGDTTASALKRVDNVIQHNPKMVIITLGGNDLKNGVPKTQASENLQLIIRKLQQEGALVVLGGIEIPLFGRDYAGFYEEIARSTGSLYVPNIYEGVLGKPQMMSDRIHPNNHGYQRIAEHFYKAIQPYL